ncbi:MAG: thiamine diphosphokinase [Bacteroidales bacterium]|nr:thiamine diphosphokinase [Bacteroidales bacterium]
MNVLILAAGEFPRKAYPRYLLESADTVVCCDSAVKAALRFGIKPVAVVGDMDSVLNLKQLGFSGEIVRIEEQDDNDLTKAMKYVMEKWPDVEEITILGATGKREAHTLGNLSLLMEYEKQYGFWARGVAVQAVSDYSTSFVVGDTCSLELGEGRAVSLFTCDQSLRVKSEGLQWKLDDVVFDNWWKATLNRATADTVKLTFNHPAPLLIILD